MSILSTNQNPRKKMDPTTRRSFVRKSLATTVSITFTGLIRAHGEGGGGTTNTTVLESTWDPNQTTVATTSGEGTTWDPNQTTFATTSGEGTTWDPNNTTYETTWNPDVTTVPPTTEEDTTTEIKIGLLWESFSISAQSFRSPPMNTVEQALDWVSNQMKTAVQSQQKTGDSGLVDVSGKTWKPRLFVNHNDESTLLTGGATQDINGKWVAVGSLPNGIVFLVYYLNPI